MRTLVVSLVLLVTAAPSLPGARSQKACDGAGPYWPTATLAVRQAQKASASPKIARGSPGAVSVAAPEAGARLPPSPGAKGAKRQIDEVSNRDR